MNNNIIKKNTIILITLVFFGVSTLMANDFLSAFNDKLSETEIKQLEQGETIIRNIGSYKKLSLTNSNNELVTEVHKELKSRNPNYLAEIIKVVPKEGNETLIQQVAAGINDFESYTEIPYFSERQQRWYDLYSSIVVNSTVGTKNDKQIEYTVEMEPFGFIDISAVLKQTDNSLYFSMINSSKVIYERKNLTCVKPKKMFNLIVLFEYNDYYFLYGIGAINAPSIFFLKDRIETSFIGRIKYFCKYMFEQITIK